MSESSTLKLKSYQIVPVDRSAQPMIQNLIDQKTKPQGALGQLETLAMQMALIQGGEKGTDRISINKPTMLVFAGDHGIAEEGVSIAPSEVTQQMVSNFLTGGAAINCFCRTNNMLIEVIDAGILLPFKHPDLINQSLGLGTANFTQTSAMEVSTAIKGLELGEKIASQQINNGCNLLAFGEMGIANTSSAAAIMAVVLDLPVKDCVGRGTGITDDVLNKKIQLIEQGVKLHLKDIHSPIDILARLGGFEIAQMVGAMLTAAEKNCIFLVDGFIATSAALLATQIAPDVIDYMVFCHQSDEKGHHLMLESMQAKPLLNLELRLGEGTGAALALSLLRAAVSFYNDMASFESAGVESV